MPKLIAPTEDEFTAWQQHPVSMYVAEAYRIAAEKQREEWLRFFEVNPIPADFTAKRLELRTREDAYRSILENTREDYIAIVDPEEAAHGRRPTGARSARSR